MTTDPDVHDVWDFEDFFVRTEPSLRRALVARLGPQRGREATAEALAFAWENQPLVQRLENPVAYLFTVGRTRTRPRGVAVIADRRPERQWREADCSFEPGLSAALGSLSARQRTAVILVVGYHWSFAEAAELMRVRRATVQRHVDRAVRHLRAALGVTEVSDELTNGGHTT